MSTCRSFPGEPCAFPLSCSADGCHRRIEIARLGITTEDRALPQPAPRPIPFRDPPSLPDAAKLIAGEAFTKPTWPSRPQRPVSDHLRPVSPSPPEASPPRPRSVRDLVDTQEEAPVPDPTIYLALQDDRVAGAGSTVTAAALDAMNRGTTSIADIESGKLTIATRIGEARFTVTAEPSE